MLLIIDFNKRAVLIFLFIFAKNNTFWTSPLSAINIE